MKIPIVPIIDIRKKVAPWSLIKWLLSDPICSMSVMLKSFHISQKNRVMKLGLL